ncbi:hypothetical protein SBA3_920005 [Candidatus Sulfopaludibacter sp. SbA3]|nr:hypothetical protein SBA3_920005 [Candidatus Sulfopaludibacter sp. SbA3]
MTTRVDAEEAALRRAVQCGDFAAAENCGRRYTSALEAMLAHLAPVQAEVRLRDACELMEWARRCLCAARARLSDELRCLRRVSVYRQTARPGAVHTWRIDG